MNKSFKNPLASSQRLPVTSPERPKKSSHKVKKMAPNAESYINKEISAPGQEYDADKIKLAKRILDENISYLSKDCYMRLN